MIKQKIIHLVRRTGFDTVAYSGDIVVKGFLLENSQSVLILKFLHKDQWTI